ncbi:glycosyltransferase [Tautonia rosea]|uniref:glycosyltransferase n=1 Tax=Tautonia rosea TaxID=2728037 RepID=UPI0028F3F761|nr:glycosyltransferase [Tautonia rosea]
MFEQAQRRTRLAMSNDVPRLPGLEQHPDREQNVSELGIDQIETQLSQALETRLVELRSRGVTAEARKVERDRLIRMLRGRLIERRLYAIWLESEVESRNQRINELAEMAKGASENLQRVEAELASLRKASIQDAVMRGRRCIGRAVRAFQKRLRLTGKLSNRLRQRIGLPGTPAADELTTGDSSIAVMTDQEGSAPLSTGEGTPGEVAGRPALMRDRNDLLRWIPPRRDPYDQWLRNHTTNTVEQLALLHQLETRPRFSVIVAQDHADLRRSRETVASLRHQIYPDRDILLVGGSEATEKITGGRTSRILESQQGLEALRAASEQCSGDYIVFLNDDARLAEEALLEFARAVAATPKPPDLIYADEDRIDRNGERFDPRFRPCWSPELMLAYHAIGRTFAVRRSMFETVGGIRPEFGRAWPYDLVLRIAEQTDHIMRVPRVLVSVPADRANDDPVDSCSTETIRASALALTKAIERRRIDARVAQPLWASQSRFPAFELDFPDRGPKVAILIPTRDRVDLLQRCVHSILSRTSYRDYEIVVIDNGSQEDETLAYFANIEPRCRVIRVENDEHGFSYARIHNQAIQQLNDSVEFLVLLNNDTEVVRSEWLSQLVGYGQMSGVGAVGGRLLYPDGRIQHAGIVTDLFDGGPGHLFKGLPWWYLDLQCLDRVVRNVSAVTAACLLVRRKAYLDVGGFDENRFAVGFNDVDLCLRLGEMGLRCVFAPRAELLHFEGASRGFALDLKEQERYLERWGHRADPYHHPALMRDDHRPGISTRSPGAPLPMRDHPIRVLVDLERLDGRGASRFVKNLIEGYRERGNIVPEVSCRFEGAMGTLLRESGIPVSTLPRHDSGDMAEHVRIIADRFLSREYDLIHVVGLNCVSSLRAASLAGIPSIWSIREAVDFRDAFHSRDEDAARATILAFSEASRVVFPAQQVRNWFAPIESTWNFDVVLESGQPCSGYPEPQGVRDRLGLASSTVVLSCLHNAIEDDIGIFLDQFAILVHSGRDVVAQVLGDPELGQWLDRNDLVRTLDHRVRFVSMNDERDVSEALAVTDLLVNVARRDLNPEIYSLKHDLQKPLVQTDVIGTDEYVRSDPTILLFDATHPETLRLRIESVLDSTDLRRGQGATTRTRRFEEMILAYERISLEAIRSSGIQGALRQRSRMGVA